MTGAACVLVPHTHWHHTHAVAAPPVLHACDVAFNSIFKEIYCKDHGKPNEKRDDENGSLCMGEVREGGHRLCSGHGRGRDNWRARDQIWCRSPLGFSYLTFATTAAFMQHLVLYFWNRFEVPALQRFIRHQMQLQQQGGVHITSSTILTSTLHIARLNTRNSSPPNDPATEHVGDVHTMTAAGAEVARHVDGSSAQNQVVGGPLLQPLGSSNQLDGVQNTNFLNSFASLLLWVLGGGSSDGPVSFLSIFRDMREQGQTYAQTPQGQGNYQPPQNSWWRRF